MKTLIAISLTLALITSCAYAEPVKHSQCYDLEELTVLDKQDVAGGKGTLYGEFAFIRDNAREQDAIKEIGFMCFHTNRYIVPRSSDLSSGLEYLAFSSRCPQ